MSAADDVVRAASPTWQTMLADARIDEAELRRRCRRRRFDRGEVVFHEGDPAGGVHLVDRGLLAVKLTTPLGDVAVLDLVAAGGTIGEHALVDGSGERTASVVAVERSETLLLDRRGFEQLRADHPAVDDFLLAVMAHRLARTNRQLLDVLFLPADVRVMRCIWRLAAVGGGAVVLTQGDVASMTGVTRSTANRILRAAEEAGVIEIGRGRLAVLDEPALRARAGLR